MKKILKCKTCKKDFVIRGGFRYCANLICTEYNKRFGAKIVQQKNEEEEE
jgi:hypothetical protein